MARAGSCKHFTGIQHDECKLGVNYKALAGGVVGYGAHIPCTGRTSICKDPIAKCDKIETYTVEEEKAWKKELDEEFKFMNAAIKAIREHDKANQDKSPRLIECPKCKGDLRYSIAKLNGHIWGKCETEGCLQWMM